LNKESAHDHNPEEEEEPRGIELVDRAIVFLTGPIDRNHLQICSALLNYHYAEDFNDPIHLIINSDGGDCSVGWSIIDMMNYIRLPVYTTAIGVVASMGADIFVNGDQRTIGEHSTLMIHPHSAMRFGSYSTLIANTKLDTIEHNRRLAHYLNNSKYNSSKSVEEKLFLTRGDDLWLTPQEVLDHGLCDEIATSHKRKRRKGFRFSLDKTEKVIKKTSKPVRKTKSRPRRK